MEQEGSIPNSHVHAKCLYREQAQFCHQPEILLPENPSQYYLLIYAWFSQVGSFSGLSTKLQYMSLLSPIGAILPFHLIILHSKTKTLLCA
jgi:hypothetical protein